MTMLERFNLIHAIKNDIKLKKTEKIGKASFISFISCFIVGGISFILSSFPGLSLFSVLGNFCIISTIFSATGLISSALIMNLLSRNDSYKKYCDSYIIFDSKEGKLYKIKTLDGETIYLDENMEYEEESKAFINNESKKEIKNIQRQVDELKEELQKNNRNSQNKIEIKNKATYYLLNDRKFSYNPAIGREKELQLLEENLLMPGVNPLIIGPAGVGKTALVRGLVYKIQRGNVCDSLKNQKIGEVSAADLVSGCRYVGDFEQKMMEFIDFARKENTIFFIDEFHALRGLGQGSNGNLDGANILKPYLSSGQLKIMGATTEDEYEKIIKADPAFERRFEVIRLNEPTGEMLYDVIDEIVTAAEKVNHAKLGNNETERKAILESLIELTDKDSKHRKYDCKINNPILIKNIIMRSFVKAKINNSNVVTIQNVCDSLQNNPNFYDSAIEETILDIECLEGDKEVEKNKKVKIINFPNNGV